MAKGPFHFKTFSVGQDGAAMKVGTDGIVLGCWSPVQGARRVMDIGAGNGYVGIMLLQRMELLTAAAFLLYVLFWATWQLNTFEAAQLAKRELVAARTFHVTAGLAELTQVPLLAQAPEARSSS